MSLDKIFPINYNALKIFKMHKGKITNRITKNNYLYKNDIKKNFVVIKVSYTNINYKDILILNNSPNLIKRFPHIPGIDASGIIYYSNSKKFKRNDKVMVIARPLGIERNGSFSEFILVPESWVDKLPRGLTLKESMIIGTSGFTAIKAFNNSLKIIQTNKKKPVLVTGASGNVGMFIVFLLKTYGIDVEVISSKKETSNIFKILNIKKIHSPKKFLKSNNFGLLNEKYSVIFDNLGGDIIDNSLKYLIKGGMFVSIGNILNNVSKINILPLILRGINIKGINAELTNLNERKKIFKRFNSLKFKKDLTKLVKVIKLKDVSKVMKSKISNMKAHRFLVKIH